MKKQIYVHVGRPKVGSTAIQLFLKNNRSVLLDNDVLYPVTGERQNASHQLAAVLIGNPRPANLPPAEELYAELIEEIEASPAPTCILSSENFYFVKPRSLAKLLKSKFDVKIICYVRRQDEVLVSSYIQELKDDTLDESERGDIERYLNRAERLRFLDYELMMGQWAQAFGKDNIFVRVYEKSQLKGDLFSDLLDVIGLPLNDDYEKPVKRVNPTPASDVLELIKMVNEYPAPDLLKKQLKTHLVNVSESIGHSSRFDAKQLFTLKQRREVLARFEKSNAATAAKYLGRSDGRLFYQGVQDDDSPNVEQSGERDTFDPERMIHIWLGMAASQQQELNRLQMQLNILKKNAATPK